METESKLTPEQSAALSCRTLVTEVISTLELLYFEEGERRKPEHRQRITELYSLVGAHQLETFHNLSTELLEELSFKRLKEDHPMFYESQRTSRKRIRRFINSDDFADYFTISVLTDLSEQSIREDEILLVGNSNLDYEGFAEQMCELLENADKEHLGQMFDVKNTETIPRLQRKLRTGRIRMSTLRRICFMLEIDMDIQLLDMEGNSVWDNARPNTPGQD